jgi:hypothetical protein
LSSDVGRKPPSRAIAERVHVVALGITTEGVKVPLGLWEGSTENASLARSLLDRGLDPAQAILFVLDGGKALWRAIKYVFGEHALVHRCHRRKERTVCAICCPNATARGVLARIRGAWALTDAVEAELQLKRLAGELQRTWPESMIEIVRHTQRNVSQALASRRHAQALERRGDAPSRAAVPADHRLQRPRQARHRDRTTTPHPAKRRAPDADCGRRVRRRARYRLTITIPVRSPSKLHDEPGNLDTLLQAPQVARLRLGVERGELDGAALAVGDPQAG